MTGDRKGALRGPAHGNSSRASVLRPVQGGRNRARHGRVLIHRDRRRDPRV
jgi:hypothetical protein